MRVRAPNEMFVLKTAFESALPAAITKQQWRPVTALYVVAVPRESTGILWWRTIRGSNSVIQVMPGVTLVAIYGITQKVEL
jgi:hypothetical protein